MATTRQGIVDIRGKQYQTVALRIYEFRQDHSVDDGWGILTDLVQCDEKMVVVKAYIRSPDGRDVATGYAQETWTGQINKTSAVENCETSAIGRALAAVGKGGENYASADEMKSALHKQARGQDNVPKVSIKDHVWEAKNTKQLFDLLVKWEKKRPIHENVESWAGIAAFARARLAETGWSEREELDNFLALVEENTKVEVVK